MEITNLDRVIIEELAAGGALTTLNKSVGEKLKKKISRTTVQNQVVKLVKEGILLDTAAVVNPIRAFENVILIVAEMETIVTPKTQADKEYGLSKFLDSIQYEFTKFKTVLGFVMRAGEYDFGMILGVQDMQQYLKFIEKLKKTKLFKRISYQVISGANKFVFNPIALP